MQSPTRRNFIYKTSLLMAASAFPLSLFGQAPKRGERKFRMSLNPGALGVKADQQTLLKLAHAYGFEAIIAMPADLVKMGDRGIKAFADDMKAKDISWGSAGLPVQFRTDEATFQKDLKGLPALAEALQKAGGTRMNTWIMPTHKTLSYRENFEEHRERLHEVGKIIGHYGIDLGLEYVGPKTLMARDRFAFIRTMKEMKELLEAITLPNVKIQLDAFHWFCAGESAADILTLSKDDIVTVDLNDARAGISADEQVDGKRELPLNGGQVDTKSFLEALVQIGYDGPIRAEPFNQKLRDMPDDQALKTTHSAMKKAFELV